MMALVDWIGQFWSLVFRIESAGAIVVGIVTAVVLASTRAVWGRLIPAFRKFQQPGWKKYSLERLKLYNSSEIFAGNCELIDVLKEQPVLQPTEETWFDVEGLDDNRYRKELHARKNTNDYIAVYRESGNIDWKSDPAHISYQTIQYSKLLALIENGERPISISCGALLVCNESGKMLLHERAAYLATYAGLLHIFGGRLLGEHHGNDRHDGSCWAAMAREVHEETKIEGFEARRYETGAYPIYVGRELGGNGGFEWLQICFLGVPVTEEQRLSAMAKNRLHWEGNVLSYNFEELDEWFCDPKKYVPSGLLQILCWLEMGAPGLDRRWRRHVKKWKGARAATGKGGDLVSTWREIERR